MKTYNTHKAGWMQNNILYNILYCNRVVLRQYRPNNIFCSCSCWWLLCTCELGLKMSNRQSSKQSCSFPLVSRMWNCKRPTSSRISIIPDTATVKHHTSTQIHNVYLSTEESSKPRAKIHKNYVLCFFFTNIHPTSIFFKDPFKGFKEVTITMHKYVKNYVPVYANDRQWY